jgi:riboflavin kinase/FMN adenylyltransferase
MGFDLVAVPPVVRLGALISSTRIRNNLTEHGDVSLAAELLGRSYEVAGVVVEGAGRGRTIGVPTANVRVPEGILVPRNGVYRCTATIQGQTGASVRGVLNIGIRPTFDAAGRSVELHILDWSGDIYGATVRIRFEARLRDERRFESVDALVAQIQRDIAEARRAG